MIGVAATLRREGAFPRRLIVGCEHTFRPRSGAWHEANLNRGGTQGVAVVGILLAAGDREHAEMQHRTQRMRQGER